MAQCSIRITAKLIETDMSESSRRRTAALLEVLGVVLAGQVLLMVVAQVLGLSLVNPLNQLTAEVTGAELVTATRQLLVLLLMYYASMFALIVPINWWHRRHGAAAYGLTFGGRSTKTLVAAGVVTAAIAAWPAVMVMLADSVYSLGETVPWRAAVFEMSWSRWQFWLFMAVGSWAVVPVLEELFYRGYCQRRLAEDWGDGPAIVGVACLFTFMHGQYLMLDAFNVAMLAGLLLMAVGFGVVFAWTRSLVPGVVAHALVNIPMVPLWQALFVSGLLLIATLTWRRALAAMRDVFSGTGMRAPAVLAATGAGYALASKALDALVLVAILMVIVAVVLQALERRRMRRRERLEGAGSEALSGDLGRDPPEVLIAAGARRPEG
jgi:membrane protease YdiL (CAAX protease family)